MDEDDESGVKPKTIFDFDLNVNDILVRLLQQIQSVCLLVTHHGVSCSGINNDLTANSINSRVEGGETAVGANGRIPTYLRLLARSRRRAGIQRQLTFRDSCSSIPLTSLRNLFLVDRSPIVPRIPLDSAPLSWLVRWLGQVAVVVSWL